MPGDFLLTALAGDCESTKNMFPRPLRTGCKISDMIRDTECRRETLRGSDRVLPWRILTTFVALLFVLTPTMLCAMPMTSMNMAEHECCKHMRSADDCSKANMNSCCATVPTDTGLVLPELTKNPVESAPIQGELVTFNAIQASPVSPLIGTHSFGSPPLPVPAHIEIFRI